MNLEPSPDLKDLEQELGVSPGFFETLIKEDPWSFVIKICALFQSLLALTIAKQFQNPDLFPEFSTLPFAESKAGLLTLALKTGAIDKNSFKFLKALAEIRNKLAHDITYSSFDWHVYYNGLDSKQKAAFTTNFTYWLKGEGRLKPSDLEIAVEKVPQFLAHKSALFAIYQLYSAGLQSRLDKQQNEEGRKLLEARMKQPRTLGGLLGLIEPRE